MCGIVGLAAPVGQNQLLEKLAVMAGQIVHRGPDDHGYVATDSLGVGMRRLSIIDVSGGHQPIANESGDIHVVCNGEIYNFADLRRDLLARGHRFSTSSDAEVIVHLYEEQGDACVRQLRGMFGLAILDQRRNRLLLARDRLGKKPLFYAQRGDRLYFASEMKSLLAADPSLDSPRLESLGQYFQFGFIHEPHTAFREIVKVPAGHLGVWEKGVFAVSPYWNVDFTVDHSRSDTEWAQRLDSTLEDAVRVRLRSDVPLGVFLSGGLDSSTVLAYARRAGLDPLRTFTVAFDRPEWDESSDARRIADHFGARHHELHLGEAEMRDGLIDTLEEITHHCDEPFGDASAIPTYHISRLARQHVTVILSGDGGDELFAGYTSYRGALFADRYRSYVPQLLGRHVFPAFVAGAAAVSPVGPRYRLNRIAKVLRDSALPPEEAYRNKVAIWNAPQLQSLLTRGAYEQMEYLGDQFLPDRLWDTFRSDRELVSRLCEVDVRSYLLDDILVKVDRMSMAHSLEVRCPLLDHHLVELAASMPQRLKVNRRAGKLILRTIMRNQLPAPTIRKGKQGFSVPLRDWFRGPLAGDVRDYLLAEGYLPPSIFRRPAVEQILDQHQRGETDHANRIWLLLAFAAWNRARRNGNAVQAAPEGRELAHG